MKDERAKKIVMEGYARIAKEGAPCCAPETCCPQQTVSGEAISQKIGYTDEELAAVPEGANMGLGCGNPVALATLKEGDTVLDLGSGGGFDCFLAANKVGENGKVIGVDMTPEMLEKARQNARRGGYRNVEFRLGEIENLPVADNCVDVLLSNCVINLVPDKTKAFAEAFRALKPGGRLVVSDIVLLKELPKRIKESVEGYVGCLSGAAMRDQYIMAIKRAGFEKVRVIAETPLPIECMANDPTAKPLIENSTASPEEIGGISGAVVSITVHGLKPSQ